MSRFLIQLIAAVAAATVVWRGSRSGCRPPAEIKFSRPTKISRWWATISASLTMAAGMAAVRPTWAAAGTADDGFETALATCQGGGEAKVRIEKAIWKIVGWRSQLATLCWIHPPPHLLLSNSKTGPGQLPTTSMGAWLFTLHRCAPSFPSTARMLNSLVARP